MEKNETIQLRDGVAKVGDSVYWVNKTNGKLSKFKISQFDRLDAHTEGDDFDTPSFLTKKGLWSYCQAEGIECPELEHEFAPKRNAAKFASDLFTGHCIVLFGSVIDERHEILEQEYDLVRRHAILTTETLIKENAFDVDFYQSVLTELKGM